MRVSGLGGTPGACELAASMLAFTCVINALPEVGRAKAWLRVVVG